MQMSRVAKMTLIQDGLELNVKTTVLVLHWKANKSCSVMAKVFPLKFSTLQTVTTHNKKWCFLQLLCYKLIDYFYYVVPFLSVCELIDDYFRLVDHVLYERRIWKLVLIAGKVFWKT